MRTDGRRDAQIRRRSACQAPAPLGQLNPLADKFFETARQYEAYALAEPPLGLDQEFDRVGGEMSGLQLRILSTFNRRYDLLAGEDLQ